MHTPDKRFVYLTPLDGENKPIPGKGPFLAEIVSSEEGTAEVRIAPALNRPAQVHHTGSKGASTAITTFFKRLFGTAPTASAPAPRR